MVIKSWIDWWIIKKYLLPKLAEQEEVSYEELEICFRQQNTICDGIG
jgi:hypothetical protein